jgi:hypothetical protein
MQALFREITPSPTIIDMSTDVMNPVGHTPTLLRGLEDQDAVGVTLRTI